MTLLHRLMQAYYRRRLIGALVRVEKASDAFVAAPTTATMEGYVRASRRFGKLSMDARRWR